RLKLAVSYKRLQLRIHDIVDDQAYYNDGRMVGDPVYGCLPNYGDSALFPSRPGGITPQERSSALSP
ncbi:MAG: hypothetical protein P8Y48_18035, partial [Novosphingobium sp.]